MDEVVLDGQNGRTLTLRQISRRDSEAIWKYEAVLSIPGASAMTEVYDHGSVPAQFFQDLAEAWSGFDGVRDYASLDGQLSFACSHDGRGTVSCVVTLGQPWPPVWSMQAVLEFGAGAHLGRLASDMAAFVAASA